MRIWKYPLEVTDQQTVKMPPGAQLLTIQVQKGQCCLWAMVDETKQPTEARNIAIYGTGNPNVPDDPGTYIASFQMEGGALVFHAFELK